MKKKLSLLILSTILMLGVFVFLALNVDSQNKQTHANENLSSQFVSEFVSPIVIDEETTEYKMVNQNNDSLNVPLRVVNAQLSETKIGNSLDYYFYNNEPFRGFSSIEIEFSPGGSSYNSYYTICYFSYNCLDFYNIYNGKYEDLFCNIASGNNVSFTVDDYANLVHYRYFLCHVIPYSWSETANYINVDAISVTTPCADEPPSVEIGTNIGNLSSEEKTTFETKINHCSTVPNSIGSGAFNISWNPFFFRNVVPHNASNQFLNQLTTGFNCVGEYSSGSIDQYEYRKTIGQYTHIIGFQKIKGLYGDFYHMQYARTSAS